MSKVRKIFNFSAIFLCGILSSLLFSSTRVAARDTSVAAVEPVAAVQISPVSVWGTNASEQVWCREGITPDKPVGTNWSRIDPGVLKQLSVGPNVVWGVQRDTEIWIRTGITKSNPKGAGWFKIDGLSLYVSVGANGHVWCIGTGKNAWYREGVTTSNLAGTKWTQITGVTNLATVSVGNNIVWVTDANGKVWYRSGITAANPKGAAWVAYPRDSISMAPGPRTMWSINKLKQIWYRDPNGVWSQIPGGFKQISVGPYGLSVWGTNDGDYIYRRPGVTESNLSGSGTNWTGIGGFLRHVAVGPVPTATTPVPHIAAAPAVEVAPVPVEPVPVYDPSTPPGGSEFSHTGKDASDVVNLTFHGNWKLPTAGQGAITFRAKSLHNIRVCLSTSAKFVDKSSIILAIGIDYNRNTAFYIPGVSRLAQITGGITDTTAFDDYWVMISDGTLSYGKGTKPGENKLLEYKNPEVSKFQYFGLGGYKQVRVDFDQIAVVSIPTAAEKAAAVATDVYDSSTPPGGSKYIFIGKKGQGSYDNLRFHPNWKLLATGRGIVRFKARAKQDIKVAVSPTTNFVADSSILLSIGGYINSRTYFIQGGNTVSNVDKGFSPSDGVQWGDYWLQLKDGVISYGQGTSVGANEILRWKNPIVSNQLYVGFGGYSNFRVEFDQIDIAVAPVVEVAVPKPSPVAAPAPIPTSLSEMNKQLVETFNGVAATYEKAQAAVYGVQKATTLKESETQAQIIKSVVPVLQAAVTKITDLFGKIRQAPTRTTTETMQKQQFIAQGASFLQKAHGLLAQAKDFVVMADAAVVKQKQAAAQEAARLDAEQAEAAIAAAEKAEVDRLAAEKAAAKKKIPRRRGRKRPSITKPTRPLKKRAVGRPTARSGRRPTVRRPSQPQTGLPKRGPRW